MKKVVAFLLLLGILIFLGCEANAPSQASLNIVKNQLILRKLAAVGNSLTAGFQSSGLSKSFQQHSYPYYIAQQIGKADEFQMPWVEDPGIGSTDTGDPSTVSTPLYFDPATGQIKFDTYPATNVPGLLSNLELPRPYDNLAVPGAKLKDVLEATDPASSSNPNNSFYSFILRNPTFGNMTMVEQAILLNPSLLLLWAGNNDVLGAALNGTAIIGVTITPKDEFQADFTALLQKIRTELTHTAVVMANIPYVTDIPYVNTLDRVFTSIERLGITSPVPVVFNANLEPVVFDVDTLGRPLYLPLLTVETGVAHVLLPELSAYQSMGLGIPDSAAMVNVFGFPPPLAAQLEAGMVAAGLTPSGLPIPGNMTLTVEESATIKQAVDDFNGIIANLAQQFQVPIVDANDLLSKVNSPGGYEGLSGLYVLLDPQNTAFSLDGVHPNTAGYAAVANEFIKVINQSFGLSIPTLNVEQYKGQYVGAGKAKLALKAVEQIRNFFPLNMN